MLSGRCSINVASSLRSFANANSVLRRSVMSQATPLLKTSSR